MATENPFLDQDPSRLPCGVLEHFVYSVDRRALLNPSKQESDEKKYQDDTESKQANKSIFVSGSEQHIYYQMLQIQNEIESVMFNTITSSDDKLKQLNDEMKKLISADEKSMLYRNHSSNVHFLFYKTTSTCDK